MRCGQSTAQALDEYHHNAVRLQIVGAAVAGQAVIELWAAGRGCCRRPLTTPRRPQGSGSTSVTVVRSCCLCPGASSTTGPQVRTSRTCCCSQQVRLRQVRVSARAQRSGFIGAKGSMMLGAALLLKQVATELSDGYCQARGRGSSELALGPRQAHNKYQSPSTACVQHSRRS